MYRRASSMSLLQMQEAIADIDQSCHMEGEELIADKDAYRPVLQSMGRVLIDSVGRLLIEARMERLQSVNEASAAFAQEALKTDALAGGPAPAVATGRGSSGSKGSKPPKSILKSPSGSKKPKGLNDSKYS